MIGILNATTLELNYLKIQPPDKDGANVLLSLPLVNPAILTLNSVSGADFVLLRMLTDLRPLSSLQTLLLVIPSSQKHSSTTLHSRRVTTR